MFRILITVLTAALLMASPNLCLAADKTKPKPPAAKPVAKPAAEPAKPAEPAKAVEPAAVPAAEPGAVAEPAAEPAKPEAAPATDPAKPEEPKAGPATEPAKPEAPEPAPAPEPPTFKPATFWPGFVNMGRVTGKPQTWRDMDGLLLDGKFKPEAKEERPTIDRPPADGTQYVILSIQLTPKKSISKYDYVLKTLKGDFPCLAMGMMRGEENAIFDPRLWEIRYETGMELLQLVFEVPAGTMEAMLVSALPLTLPPPSAELKFLEDAPPAPPATPAADPGAAPATEPAAAPAGEPAAAPPAKEATAPAPATAPAK